tara:strand:+ start:299 stop:1030 length:732 start_codon:yes stop_codon:yes gene_type:complete
MTVEEMHYEFKLKLNKVDSLDYQNFFVPEIDWYLNEAMKMFIKQRYGVANPKRQGFEVTQKRIDDLRNLVVAGASQLAALSPVTDLEPFYTANLPNDYMFLVRVNADATKEGCESKIIGGIQVQRDDLDSVLGDPFYSPSFEWGETPVVFTEDGISAYSDGSFTITNILVDYIRHPERIAWGDGVDPANSYNYPDGTTAAANQSCELAEHTHNEIVDLAVLIASGDLDNPNFQVKNLRANINE